MRDVDAPSGSTGVVPEIEEFALFAGPATKLIELPVMLKGEVSETVFVSATVDLRVHVDTPDALEAAHAPYALPSPVFVAEKVGVIPPTPTFEASLKMMVTRTVLVLFATVGPAATEIDEFAATADPGANTTFPPTMVGFVKLRILVSAVVEASVQ